MSRVEGAMALLAKAGRIMWLRWLAGLVAGLVLVIYFDPTRVQSQLRGVDWRLAIPAIAGLTGLQTLAAFTWRILVRNLTAEELPWLKAVRLYYASQAVGSVTPANVGADAYRALAIRSSGMSIARALSPVMLQRFTSYAGLALLAGTGLVYLNQTPLTFIVGALIVGATLVAGGLACALPIARSVIARFSTQARLGHTLPSAATSLLLGVAFHAAAVGLTTVLVVATISQAPLLPVLAVVTVARMSLAVPFLPSGLGVQEGAYALMFPEIGLDSEVGIAVSLLSRLALLLTMLAGIVALIGVRAGR